MRDFDEVVGFEGFGAVDLGEFEVEKIGGIGEFTERRHGEDGEDRVFEVPVAGDDAAKGKAFLVLRPKTIEVRCDGKLSKVLREKYETVMVSRYFGRGGVEIVPSGQLSKGELEDLVRLSYNMTQKLLEER